MAKSEIRNPKSETNSNRWKSQNCENGDGKRSRTSADIAPLRLLSWSNDEATFKPQRRDKRRGREKQIRAIRVIRG